MAGKANRLMGKRCPVQWYFQHKLVWGFAVKSAASSASAYADISRFWHALLSAGPAGLACSAATDASPQRS